MKDEEKQIGKLNGEAVYLVRGEELCIEKDHSRLVEMTEEEKDQFIKQKFHTNFKVNVDESDLTTLSDKND